MWEKKIFRSQGRAGTSRLGPGSSADAAASEIWCPWCWAHKSHGCDLIQFVWIPFLISKPSLDFFSYNFLCCLYLFCIFIGILICNAIIHCLHSISRLDFQSKDVALEVSLASGWVCSSTCVQVQGNRFMAFQNQGLNQNQGLFPALQPPPWGAASLFPVWVGASKVSWEQNISEKISEKILLGIEAASLATQIIVPSVFSALRAKRNN